MPKLLFEKGNKLAPGGKRPGAGRPSKQVKANKIAAAEIARQYIEKNIKPVLKTYRKNAEGHYENRWTEGKAPKKYEVWVVDAASTRHWIDKFVPAAKQELQISGGLRIVKLDIFDPDGGGK
jgi:hypothetical protein